MDAKTLRYVLDRVLESIENTRLDNKTTVLRTLGDVRATLTEEYNDMRDRGLVER